MAKKKSPVLGARVMSVRTLTREEVDAEGWDYRGDTMALVLDSRAVIYASRDPEGNGPGCLFGYQGEETFRV